jgi:phosphatidate phosphatase APP1
MDHPLRNLENIALNIGDGASKVFEKFDSKDPIIVLPFRGYAGKDRIFVKGRVLEDENIFRGKTDSEIRNIINNFKRFETDEIPEADVRITCNGQSYECKTDAEGYFTLDQKWTMPLEYPQNNWVPVKVELLAPVRTDDSKITAEGEVRLPPRDADYGVISDMDDTILQTHVGSLFRLKMLYTTFFKSAHQRLPIEGMAELLQAFSRRGKGKKNPVFYVSHSPWNIYDLLNEFLQLQHFPKGPILLRDYGLNPSGAYAHHKKNTISHILKTYPQLPFIMIGDAAEEDADIYIDIAKEFSDRVEAIYIRRTRDAENARRIKNLIENSAHVNAALIHSSDEIKQHALEHGFLKDYGSKN